MTLRSWIVGVVGLALAVAIGVPTALFDAAKRDAAHAAQRAKLSYAALDLVALARTEGGKLNIERFAAIQPRPGEPVSLFIDGKGAQLDGDITEGAAFRRAVLKHANTGDNLPFRLGDRLVVTEAIARPQAPDVVFAVAVSYLDARPVDREVASASRGRWAAALGLWVALTALLGTVLLRLLGRPLDAAESERTFFADAAHELKTPWAIVRARADAALRRSDRAQALPDHDAADLQSIAATASSAGRTIDEMLTLARLDRGVLGEQRRVRFDSVADTCVSELLERHGEALDVELSGTTVAVVMGDESLLRHAVSNLLENAVRHGDAPIRVSITRQGGRVRLSVIDSGAGIAPSQRELIFERFHRASARGSSGSGLGLSIARAAIEAHRGKLTYRERVDSHGAVFTIDLPAA
jgi:two-component system, OmpR family, sensor kinase